MVGLGQVCNKTLAFVDFLLFTKKRSSYCKSSKKEIYINSIYNPIKNGRSLFTNVRYKSADKNEFSPQLRPVWDDPYPELEKRCLEDGAAASKALQNWRISVKALYKWLRKLMIITKRLIATIIVSFVNVND